MQIGFKALEARFSASPAQPLRVRSVIGTARVTRESPQGIENQYPAVYQPADRERLPSRSALSIFIR